MPIYEYTCTRCSHGFEELRSFDHMNAPASCPDCEGEGERQLSVFMSFTETDGQTRAVAGGGGGCCGGGGGGCACSMSA